MLVVTLSDGRTVKFNYNHFTGTVPDTYPFAGEARRMTTAEVVEVGKEQADGFNSEYKCLGVGVAVTHPKDTFSRYKGRKQATRYAMEAADFDVATRREVWSAFLSTYGARKA